MNCIKKCLVVIIVVIGVMFLACESEVAATTFVSVRINPEVGLLCNEDGEVVEVVSLNEDGDIVMSNLDVVGKDVSDVVTLITNEAVETGYIDIDDSDVVVNIDVEGEDEKNVAEIKESIIKDCNEYFKNKGIFGKVSQDTLTNYLQLANELSLNCGHVKLLMLAMDLNPELNFDEVKAMSIKELIKLIHEQTKNNKLSYKLNKEFKEARIALKDEYQELFIARKRIDEINELLELEQTEEDKISFEGELTTLQEKVSILEVEYKEKMNSLKDYYKDLKSQEKIKCKETNENKKATSKNKNLNHENNFNQKNKKEKEELTKKIEEYQNNLGE